VTDGTQDGWVSAGACQGASYRLLTRSRRDLGGSTDEARTCLKLTVITAAPTRTRALVARQPASTTRTVETIETRPVKVRPGCEHHTCKAAGGADDVQASASRGRSLHRAETTDGLGRGGMCAQEG